MKRYNSVFRDLLKIICVSSLILILSAFNSSLSAKVEQVFHRGNGEEVESLDPHRSTGVPSGNVIVDLYEGLMTYNQQGELINGQAEKYEISKDHKTYTFTLRKNLKWSNGANLTAHDFVAGLRRTVDPSVGSINAEMLKPIKNAKQVIAGELNPTKLAVMALDNRRLKIELEEPTPYFLELLTHSTSMPIYQPNLKKYPDSFTRPGKHITNGPFKLSEWLVNSHLTLVKNPHFREASQVKLDKVIFYPISEQSVELKRYRAGDLDMTNTIPDVNFDWIKSNLGDELYIAPHLATYYFGFNLTKSPFKGNLYLRKALSLAIDKNIISSRVLRSGQIATDSFVPSSTNNYKLKNSEDHIASLNKLDQNRRLELAREYYKKAGFSKINPAEIKILYNTQESHKSVSIAIAAMWKKALGVKTSLINQEWKVFLRTRQEKKDTEFFREGWVGDYNDPMTFLDLYTTDNPQNHSGYSNLEYDKLLKDACLELDLDKRAQLLRKAEAILINDAPIVPIYTYVSRHLVKPHIGGFATNLLDRTYDRYIYIKDV